MLEHRRKMDTLSRDKTYQVSEDIFESMMRERIVMNALVAKLETILEYTEEDDPKHEVALSLLEYYYENAF